MSYSGFIKGSRTLDIIAIQSIVDAISLGFLAYSPEQWHISIPIYGIIRIGFGVLSAWLRFKTSTPIGAK
jgi:hypothetical protein